MGSKGDRMENIRFFPQNNSYRWHFKNAVGNGHKSGRFTRQSTELKSSVSHCTETTGFLPATGGNGPHALPSTRAGVVGGTWPPCPIPCPAEDSQPLGRCLGWAGGPCVSSLYCGPPLKMTAETRQVTRATDERVRGGEQDRVAAPPDLFALIQVSLRLLCKIKFLY